MFKVKLLTSMVSTDQSYAPGDIITCSNDQAWRMVNDQLGVVVGSKKPVKPKEKTSRIKDDIDLDQNSRAK